MSVAGEAPRIFSDLALARRLERAEAVANAKFVEARARISPDVGAEWIEVGGAYAMYDGVSSPCTQTFGLGLFEPIGAAEMQALEDFYQKRGADVFHEVSPLSGLDLVALLNERGYRPIEYTSVMHRPISPDIEIAAARNERIRVRIVGKDEERVWSETAARGWSSEVPELRDFILELGQLNAMRENTSLFLAELDGQPIAAAVLCIAEGVATLAGASTVPEGRRQGAQLALLESRLRYAAAQGCDIAMICAQPGSASQRNAERHGFRIAYTRIKWQLAGANASGS